MIWKLFNKLLIVVCLLVYSGTNAQSVNLEWTPSASPGLTGHNIYRTRDLDSSFVLIDTVNLPDSSYSDTDVTLGMQYFYVATAMDIYDNESGFSNMVDTLISPPIPVELMAFTARIDSGSVVLEWRTVTETGNYGFEIERGFGGGDFGKIGFIPGHGTTTIEHSYRFRDDTTTGGTIYYRLKQIDYDGDFTYSQVVATSIGMPETIRLEQNYPNPFNLTTFISYSLPKDGHISLNVYNFSGQLVQRLVDEFKTGGRYTVRWDGLDLQGRQVASGTYIYKIETLESSMFRKMILLK